MCKQEIVQQIPQCESVSSSRSEDESASQSLEPVLCTECFDDEGLKLDAALVGFPDEGPCPNCSKSDGLKLDLGRVQWLMHRFFTIGTIQRPDYGGFPALVMNDKQKTSVKLAPWSGKDIELLSKVSGNGVFYYGPRFWMFGEVEPLKDLVGEQNRQQIIDRIVSEYPSRESPPNTRFYRMRKNPSVPESVDEYDSPPNHLCGNGRLDSPGFPVLYASQDMQVCVHECRTTVDDETFVATLVPTRTLKLLDLTAVLVEGESVTEFESLDLTVHMLFLAKSHSYEVSRAISRAAKAKGFDGIIYPSYFSLIRTGATPFETVIGMSIRHIPQLADYAANQIISNVALFGHPICEGSLRVKSINRVVLAQVDYRLTFGPVGYENAWVPDTER